MMCVLSTAVLYKNIKPAKERSRRDGPDTDVLSSRFWIMRTGGVHDAIPAELAHWHQTFVRRVGARKVGRRRYAAMPTSSNSIDSTIVRAHQHSAGQIADIEQAEALIKGQSAEFIVADKGYDSDAFVSNFRCSG